MQLRKKGIALVASLALLVVTAGVLALIFSSTMRDINHGANDAAIIKSLMLARGGATLGANILHGPIRGELNNIVQESADYVGKWQFGKSSLSSHAKRPTAESVMQDLVIVSQLLQPKIDALLCNKTITPNGGNEQVTVTVFVTDTACGGTISLPNKVRLQGGRFVESANRTYSIPYVMVSEAKVGNYKRNIVVQGEYQFRVGGDKFSKYALFTNDHNFSGSDNGVWFTSNTLFEGPVHTNGHFRYYGEPWFGGQVTSAGFNNPIGVNVPDPQNPPTTPDTAGAHFYGTGFHDAGELASSTTYTSAAGIKTSPAFAGGVDWNSTYVEIPDNAFDFKKNARESGIRLNDWFGGKKVDLYSFGIWASDSLCTDQKPLTRDNQGKWKQAVNQCFKACLTSETSSCSIFRVDQEGRLYKDGNKVITNYKQVRFNGAIYLDGKIDRLEGPPRIGGSDDPKDAPPAIASFSRITLAVEDDVRITTDIKYQDPPCTGYPSRLADNSVKPSVCDNLDANNLFGLWSPHGNILIGNNHGDISLDAPYDVAIHGSLMASLGVVTVEDYGKGSPKGSVNLLGGIIENSYGAFGTFNPTTGLGSSGFSRKFTYDKRFSEDIAPPFFPGTDMATVEGVFTFSLGQREQVY